MTLESKRQPMTPLYWEREGYTPKLIGWWDENTDTVWTVNHRPSQDSFGAQHINKAHARRLVAIGQIREARNG